MQQYYSNGKLLLSGEYLILDGAKGLALPSRFGQEMLIHKNEQAELSWNSLDVHGNVWFNAVFNLDNLAVSNFTGDQNIALTLEKILQTAALLNPEFLNQTNGFEITTSLGFPRDWGLGSSSTLINNIAQWFHVDPYKLLSDSFGGSGYDIACAQHDSAIIYRLEDRLPVIEEVVFDPVFKEQLYFVFLNKKQVTKDSIIQYKKDSGVNQQIIEMVSAITEKLLQSRHIQEFEALLQEHESILSNLLKTEPVQKTLFKDYWGQTKSLGAWGGDFILATGNEDSPGYFIKKGFKTVMPFDTIIKT